MHLNVKLIYFFNRKLTITSIPKRGRSRNNSYIESLNIVFSNEIIKAKTIIFLGKCSVPKGLKFRMTKSLSLM